MAPQTIHDPLLQTPTKKRGWITYVAISCFLFLALVVAIAISWRASLFDFSNELRSPADDEVGSAYSYRGVVTTDDTRCAKIGVSILRKGGHAVDAAVAAAICQGVVNQMSSGIGGGDFIVIKPATSNRVVAINSRETAPAAASENMYENDPIKKYLGPMSTAIPGEIAGLHYAWSKYGRLPWKTLFEASIKLAKGGFVISPFSASNLDQRSLAILDDPGLRQVYSRNGTVLKTGDICYNVALGNALEQIANYGPKAFYDGVVGKKLINDIRRGGGIMTLDDLKNYTVRVTDAVTVKTMGYTIFGMPPPSTGTVGLAMVLNIFQSYRTKNPLEGPLGLHRLVEAFKHMFAIRAELGDPDFVDISDAMSKMLSPAYAKKIRKMIFDNTTFPPEYYKPRHTQERGHGTSNLCVVDEDRNVVSLTATVNHGLGSGMLSPSTGIVLNNQMDDFSTPTEVSPDRLPPSPANFIRPGKRPVSSMTPIIILKDNQLVGVLGGSGGLTIIPGVTQVFINNFILGMKPLAAVRSPRVYHRLIPNVVSYENVTVFSGEHVELSADRIKFLKGRGHEVKSDPFGAVCNFVYQDVTNLGRKGNKVNALLTAVGDYRKGGLAAAL